jgi:hypothetical protein
VQLGLDDELFGSGVGDTAVNAKLLRAVTVTGAVRVAGLPPEAETWTLTLPLLTIVPDHELVVCVLVTVLLLESVNFQLENVAPVGAPLTLHVTLLPRVTEEGVQLSFATLSPPPGRTTTMGAVKAVGPPLLN